MKIRIGLFGGGGKMGQAVEQMLPKMKTQNSLVPYLFIGRQDSELFAISAGELSNIEDEVLADVDVWIDFSSPQGLNKLLKITQKHRSAVVSGTTGLSKTDFTRLKSAAKNRRMFWASNMSPGLWAFRQAMKGFAGIANFDFALEEIHHTQKKDRPSGTAKTLRADLENITGKKIETPTSHRLGGVFGVHAIIAASSNEMITMQHQALNRTVFAEGALMACDWLHGKKPGLYSMDNMFLKSKR